MDMLLKRGYHTAASHEIGYFQRSKLVPYFDMGSFFRDLRVIEENQ